MVSRAPVALLICQSFTRPSTALLMSCMPLPRKATRSTALPWPWKLRMALPGSRGVLFFCLIVFSFFFLWGTLWWTPFRWGFMSSHFYGPLLKFIATEACPKTGGGRGGGGGGRGDPSSVQRDSTRKLSE